ncbi:MAG: TauD/TfdA family dioxygenase [Pseudacidovorax sp.]|nr:TauD/TfdA family dioxygenase [Pseudacidovorax sp.]
MKKALDGLPPGWNTRRLAPSLGLEVRDLFLPDLDSAGIAKIRQLLLAFRVLVFRRQAISPAQHVAFARQFGPLEGENPLLSASDAFPELIQLHSSAQRKGAENLFHSDTAFQEKPSMGSILRCVICPEVGGDTIFCNMVQAYDGLPDEVKAQIDGMVAVNDVGVALRKKKPAEGAAAAQQLERYRPVEHPVVVTHPETGESILYVNEIHTTHLSNYREVLGADWGMDTPTRIRALFDMLVRQAKIPEYQVRVHWEPDTIVFWDNRAVQHYAVSDYFPSERHMMRATIRGDVPIRLR